MEAYTHAPRSRATKRRSHRPRRPKNPQVERSRHRTRRPRDLAFTREPPFRRGFACTPLRERPYGRLSVRIHPALQARSSATGRQEQPIPTGALSRASCRVRRSYGRRTHCSWRSKLSPWISQGAIQGEHSPRGASAAQRTRCRAHHRRQERHTGRSAAPNRPSGRRWDPRRSRPQQPCSTCQMTTNDLDGTWVLGGLVDPDAGLFEEPFDGPHSVPAQRPVLGRQATASA